MDQHGELRALYLAPLLTTLISITNQHEQEVGATIFDKRQPAAADA